jgi:isopenicillin N synthase-like dioxygenase
MVAPTALPLLDISEFRRDPQSTGGRDFVEQLREVVHDVGFFYVTGHGVPEELADRAHQIAGEFFALPEADRLEIENVRSPQFRGYTRFGHEVTNGRADLREQVDISRDVPARAVGPDEPQWLRLRGPNVWPSALPEFRDVFTEWADALEVVGQTLLRAMALALGQPADRFAEVVSPPEVLLKVIRYVTPIDDGSGRSESISARQGVGAHRDTGLLTFVHQDEVGGLQVERDGHLVDVPAIRGALVVNIGEMFQLVTRGYFKATVHKVVSPPPGIERISIAYFFNPKLEATLAPLDLPAELAALAPGGASADPNNPILANYGDNSLKVRLRAHPDVAERHHADLLATGAWRG